MTLLACGLPLWLSWQRILPQCGRPGFNPWVGKIPWRRERLPTLVFWPREFHGMYSLWGLKEWDTAEALSLHVLASVVSAIVQEPERSLASPSFAIGTKTDLFQSSGTLSAAL